MKTNTLVRIALIVLVFLSSSFSVTNSPFGDDLPNGPKGVTVIYNGKLVFIMTMPTEAYTVIDKDKPDGDGLTMTAQITSTIEKAIKKENKGKMDHFDAAIVYGEYKVMEFVKFNNGLGASSDNGNAYPYIYNTKKTGTKYVYFAATPIKPYDVLETFEKGALGQTGIGVANNTGDPYKVRITSFCEKATKLAKDKSLDWDAIIVKQNPDITTDAMLGNDFGKEIQIIKFK